MDDPIKEALVASKINALENAKEATIAAIDDLINTYKEALNS